MQRTWCRDPRFRRVRDEQQTDAELLSETVRGDAAAFARLVRRYIRPATFLAAQLVGDRDEAEDIVPDAFSVVYRQARTFDTAHPFRTVSRAPMLSEPVTPVDDLGKAIASRDTPPSMGALLLLGAAGVAG